MEREQKSQRDGGIERKRNGGTEKEMDEDERS